MRPFKRRPIPATFLAVLWAVQTVAGPASFAAADTLRPLNQREDRAGLEELTRQLAPDTVRPSAAGLEENSRGTLFLRATPEGFFAAEEIHGPRPVPGRGKRLQFLDPPRMGEGVDRADPQLQEKVDLLLQKIASANLDLSPSGTLNISAVKEAAQRIYPGYSTQFPDQIDSLDFGIFLDGLSWDLFSRAGEFTVFIRDPDRRVTVWRRYGLEQEWERQSYLNGGGTIWVAPVRQIATPPEDTGRTSALRAAWSPSDSFREFNKNLPGILAGKRDSPVLTELRKRWTWIYAHSSVFFPYVYERLNREEEIQHARLASWARLFYGMESFKPAQEFALDVEAAVLPGGYVDRRVWAAQKGKMLSSADWNEQDWDKLNRMSRAILELEGKLGALARVMEEALRDPNLSPADREELAYAIFFYQWVWFEDRGVRARKARKVPGSPPGAYLPALPAFFFDYLNKKFPSAQAVIEDLNRPAPSSPIVPRGTRALEIVTGFYDASFLNDDQRLKLLTAPAAGLEEGPKGEASELDVLLGEALGIGGNWHIPIVGDSSRGEWSINSGSYRLIFSWWQTSTRDNDPNKLAVHVTVRLEPLDRNQREPWFKGEQLSQIEKYRFGLRHPRVPQGERKPFEVERDFKDWEATGVLSEEGNRYAELKLSIELDRGVLSEQSGITLEVDPPPNVITVSFRVVQDGSAVSSEIRRIPPPQIDLPRESGDDTTGLEEAQERAEQFVLGLVRGNRALIPVVISAGLEEQHPELRALGRLRGLPILFARRMTPPEVAVELITRWDAREAVFAGLEEEVARYRPIIEEAGITVRKVTLANAGQLLLAILAQAAGMEEATLAARDGVGRLLDDLDALGQGA